MSDGFSRPYVRVLVLSLVLLVSMASPAIAFQGGVNEDSSLEGTEIVSIEYYHEASAGESFSIAVFLTEEARDNGTTVNWVTQVCINSGVCYAPENNSLESDDGFAWRGSIIPPNTVTYINWKIETHTDNGNSTNVPDTGFGWRVWSDCWYDNGSWGGNSTDCQDDEGGLPGFGASLAIASLSMAALMARRD